MWCLPCFLRGFSPGSFLSNFPPLAVEVAAKPATSPSSSFPIFFGWVFVPDMGNAVAASWIWLKIIKDQIRSSVIKTIKNLRNTNQRSCFYLGKAPAFEAVFKFCNRFFSCLSTLFFLSSSLLAKGSTPGSAVIQKTFIISKKNTTCNATRFQ